MASLNKLSIIGNLGANPELRYTPEGKAVVNLRIAVNRSWPDGKGGWNEETMWVTADQWDERAERAAEKLRKGDQVYVEGRLKPVRQFQRQDNTIGFSLEVQAHTVLKLGKSERNGDEPQAETRPQGAEIDVDDIPF